MPLQIGVHRETAQGEARVALAPDTVRRLARQDVEVVVERGAGERAFLTDEAFEAGDFRSTVPRLTRENREANRGSVDLLRRIADDKGATPAQVALAWLLAQKPWIVPIPGTTKARRVDENVAAADLALTAADLEAIEAGAAGLEVSGHRYSAGAQAMIDR